MPNARDTDTAWNLYTMAIDRVLYSNYGRWACESYHLKAESIVKGLVVRSKCCPRYFFMCGDFILGYY